MKVWYKGIIFKIKILIHTETQAKLILDSRGSY